MSSESGFTSKPILNTKDYDAVIKCFEREGNSKYFKMTYREPPIIQGIIGEMGLNYSGIDLAEIVQDIETTEDIEFIVACDGGEIQLVCKYASGGAEVRGLTAK